jgi:hypothetical protein
MVTNHQERGVPPPSRATAPSIPSAAARTGRVDAIAMMTTTKMGSVKFNASGPTRPLR